MAKFYTGKKDLFSFPFDAFTSADPKALEDVALHVGLTHNSSWILPQLLAHIAEWKISRNVDGQISTLDFLKSNIDGSDQFRVGIYRVLTTLSRSCFIKKQTDINFAPYSLLVPLFMAAFKRHHGIKYSEWSKDGLDKLLPASLASTMTTEIPPEIRDRELLLEQRSFCLTYGSGPKAGQEANPITRWTALRVKGSVFEGMPSLVNTMMLQLWVAHPSIRNDMMVLDPENWDTMPEPLLSTDLIKPTKTYTSDLPW